MNALTEGLEDYLEAILLEERERRFVRTKNLAERLKVKSPSVNAAVKELTSLGMVEHESYGYIELTSLGRKQAEHVYSRHKTLYHFFVHTLGLPIDVSEVAACGIEHHLNTLALKKLTKLLDFLENEAKTNRVFSEKLQRALGNG